MQVDEGLLGSLVAIAREAGEQIMVVYDSGNFDAEIKGDGSPLTAADKAANAVIVKRLAELTPEIPLLSEESKAIPYAERRDWSRYWLIDPLDGTKEFIKRNGEFTVNIALIENNRPRAGVVHVPVTGMTYAGIVGDGAVIYADGNDPQPITVKPFDGGAPVIAGSRSHGGEALQKFIAAVEQEFGGCELITSGSSIKLCLVAEGKAHLYPRLGLTSEWDTAAAQCVVEAAGGTVTDLSGLPLAYNKEDILNPFFLVSAPSTVDWLGFIEA